MTDTIVYCHGLPGAPFELTALAPALSSGRVHALDRLDQQGRSVEERVLAAFDALRVEGPVIVAGFSLGAMSAAYLAARRAALVRKLLLISPAAPLQLGDFLPVMAGRAVFKTALGGGVGLHALAALQAAAVSLAPRRVVQAMFASSPKADKDLLAAKSFVDVVASGLRACLHRRRAAYCAELRDYVQPWADVLDAVRCKTEIWQGDLDDWTPPAMAEALRDRLGPDAGLTICPGLGHYSTLLLALAHLQRSVSETAPAPQYWPRS